MYKSKWSKIIGAFCILFAIVVGIWLFQTIKTNDNLAINYIIAFSMPIIFFAIMGIWLIYKNKDDITKEEILSKSIRYIDAKITKIVPYNHRGQRNSIVCCEYIDDVTGEKHTFKSDEVFNSPQGIKDIMEKENISTIKIKVSEDMKVYEMDVKHITSNNNPIENMKRKVDKKTVYMLLLLVGGFILLLIAYAWLIT